MAVDRKLLIIESSRYEAFRLRRELLKQNPTDVITVMMRAQEGLHELAQADYDLAIIDFSSLLAYEVNGHKFLPDLLVLGSVLKLVVIDNTNDQPVSDDLARDLEAQSTPLSSAIINRDEHTHLLLPGLVDRLLTPSGDRSGLEVGQRFALSTVLRTDSNKLVGKLAHEVNNPLMSIMGTVELLLEQSDHAKGETGRKLRIIQRSARRIQKSLERIKDECGQPEIDLPTRNRLTDIGILSKI